MSREEAFKIVERVPLRARIQRHKHFQTHKGVKYGPYLRWIARWEDEDGRQRSAYIRDEDKARVELAHEIVSAEIEAAERAARTPQLVRLQELQRRAGVKRASPSIGDAALIPIVEVGRRRPK